MLRDVCGSSGMEGRKSEVIQRLESYRAASGNGKRSHKDFWALHSLLYPAQELNQSELFSSQQQQQQQCEEAHETNHEEQRNEKTSFLSSCQSQLDYQSKMTEIFQKDFEDIYLNHQPNESQIKYFHEVLTCDFHDFQRISQRRERR